MLLHVVLHPHPRVGCENSNGICNFAEVFDPRWRHKQGQMKLLMLRRKDNFFLCSSRFLTETPYDKRKIIKRKTNRSLITCIPPVYMEDIQENWVIPWNGPSYHLKCHLQLNIKGVGGWGSQLWKVIRKDILNQGMIIIQI